MKVNEPLMQWLCKAGRVCKYRARSGGRAPLGVILTRARERLHQRDELRIVLLSCLRESAISLPEEKLDQLTLALFKLADKDCSGAITFDELPDELRRFPGVMENLTIRYRPISCRGTASAGIRHQVRSVA